MPFLDARKLDEFVKRPGWRGRKFCSPSMTFVHWDFDAGATIPSHHHEQEEVWQILDGQLEITIGDVTQKAGAGMVAIVPPDTPHAVKVLAAGRAIVTDYPTRPGF
ncbi:MAG: cupin domain-containing protein [Rhizomicrobium sp.]